MADPHLLAEARALLAHTTPLADDCGTLCGHRCCADYAPDVGVYLLPGEIALFDGTEDWLRWKLHSTKRYDFAPSWSKYRQIRFMQCHKLCDRDRRPFECRTYPLVPCLKDDGSLEMYMAPWAQGVCPLADPEPAAPLRPEFVAAARRAWTLLMQDPDLSDHIRWLTAQIKASAGAIPVASNHRHPHRR